MATGNGSDPRGGPNSNVRGQKARSAYGTPDEQLADKMKTMGFFNEDRMGRIMASAVEQGVVAAFQSMGQQPGQPRRAGEAGGAAQRHYDPNKFPAMNMKGFLNTVGMIVAGRVVGRQGQANSFTTPGMPPETGPSSAQQTASQTQYTSQAAQAQAQATGAPPPPTPGGPPPSGPPSGAPPGAPPEEPPEGQTLWVQQGGGPPTAFSVPPAAPEEAETAAVGAETAEAAAGTTAASQAIGVGGARQAIGAALMEGGIARGAWAGLSSLLPDAVSGPLGLGVGAVMAGYEGLNMYASQQAQGLYYSGMLGGTVTGGQLGPNGPNNQFQPMGVWGGERQRLLQTGFRLSQLGNLTGAQANALFQGVTGLDMTGAQRTNAMNTAIQMYDQLGVSIQSSLQLITTAAQNGNKELAGLAGAINQVTQAAVAGGVNANVARNNLNNAYQAAGQYFQGAAGAAVAGGLASAQTQMGQLFSNVNLSSMLNQNTMMMMANQAGPGGTPMGYDQFIAAVTKNPGMLGTNLLSAIQGIIGPGTDIVNQIGTAAATLTRQNPSDNLTRALATGKTTQADIQNLATQILSQDPNQIGAILPAIWAQFGVQGLSTQQAMAQTIALYTGNFAPNTNLPTAGQGNLAQRRIAGGVTPAQAMNPTTGDLDQALRQYVKGLPKAMQQNYLEEGLKVIQQASTPAGQAALTVPQSQMYGNIRQQWGTTTYPNQVNPQVNQINAAIGMPSTISQTWEGIFGKTAPNQAREWYQQNAIKTSTRDPVMEQLLKNNELNNAQTVFSVNLPGGGTQLATAKELEQHYMAQVQSGNVTIAASQNGNLVGQNIAQVLGITQTTRNATAGTGWSNSIAGQKAQQQLQQQVTQEQKNIVTVVPSQQLLQWMQFNGQGNVNIANDNYTATNSTPPSYPTTTSASSVISSLPGG
jgi:hypothetical protein